MFPIKRDWYERLKPQLTSSSFVSLQRFLTDEYSRYAVYPKPEDVFSALNYVSYADVKVVIVGQDPYHNEGQAHGLSFSVLNQQPPPSLINIYTEIENDLGRKSSTFGDLTSWAMQGVLLLNTSLTVRSGMANSHQGKGWEEVTTQIIELLSQRSEPVIFLLWGSHAIAFKNKIDFKRHFALTAPHPSPLSAYRGFFGCKHFSKANEILRSLGKEEIVW